MVARGSPVAEVLTECCGVSVMMLLGGVVAGEVPALLVLTRPTPMLEEGGNGGSTGGIDCCCSSAEEGEVVLEAPCSGHSYIIIQWLRLVHQINKLSRHNQKTIIVF